MATENLEDVDNDLEDENLDALLEQPGQETPPAPPSETKETPAPSTTDPEDEDDADDGVEIPDDSTDPKDIAIRNLRNANKRLRKKLKPKREIPDTPPSPEPEPKPAAGSPLYNRYVSSEFKTNVMFAKETDPTIVQRIPLIKKIMFQEMPELLEKPNGFDIANDLAKGRTITVASGAKEKELPPQTPAARPAGATPKRKAVTQQEYDQMSEEERTAYENSQMGA